MLYFFTHLWAHAQHYAILFSVTWAPLLRFFNRPRARARARARAPSQILAYAGASAALAYASVQISGVAADLNLSRNGFYVIDGFPQRKVMDENSDTQIFHELLKCSNCKLIMTMRPVYKCEGEHILCWDCYAKLAQKVCKFCGGQFGNSVFLEGLAQNFGEMTLAGRDPLTLVLQTVSLIKAQLSAIHDEYAAAVEREALLEEEMEKRKLENVDLSTQLAAYRHSIYLLTKALIERNFFGRNLNGIGLKKLGELEIDPFINAMKGKYGEEEAKVKGSALRDTWQIRINDAVMHGHVNLVGGGDVGGGGHVDGDRWQPMCMVNGLRDVNLQDERLVRVRDEIGDQAVNAIVRTLRELYQFDRVNDPAYEIWDFNKGEEAALYECIDLLLYHIDRLRRLSELSEQRFTNRDQRVRARARAPSQISAVACAPAASAFVQISGVAADLNHSGYLFSKLSFLVFGKVMDGDSDTEIFHELLKCPNCQLIMTKGPVYKCEGGHILCCDCYEKLAQKACISCGGQFGNSDLLEKLAQKFGEMTLAGKDPLTSLLQPVSLIKAQLCAMHDKYVAAAQREAFLEQTIEKIALVNADMLAQMDDCHYSRYRLIEALIERSFFGRNLNGGIGLRRYGELYVEPFINAMKVHGEEAAEVKGSELRDTWQIQINNVEVDGHVHLVGDGDGDVEDVFSDGDVEDGDGDGDGDGDVWRPMYMMDGIRFVDFQDERLIKVKNELGDEVHSAIVRALEELYQVDAINDPDYEIWDFKQGKEAALDECTELLLYHIDRQNLQ
ncbi:Zinc finger, RING/FYVE/PHD-type domain containing protein [Trema orientale]|uniref:Zinc finger, RING/FYVE/PHD-type domain containing protein n=1 Tax=Trema orientale TaxID=63057 RepID=A0A2P5CLH7_TREOI|nr:Zinc finger, RING/FYVE/PHD-type domain containing protein [Trema orientale]